MAHNCTTKDLIKNITFQQYPHLWGGGGSIIYMPVIFMAQIPSYVRVIKQ